MAFVAEAVAAGISLIDTAHTYTGGESEETIGDALSPVPDGAFGVYAPKPSRSTTCTGSIPRPRSRRASP
jgi:predicted aldo/keto reductase-like oxidoreductase